MYRVCLTARAARGAGVGLIIFALAAWYLHMPQNLIALQTSLSCSQDPIADKVVVAVKTGATEATERIPTLMKTSLRCAKHVLFFSDLEEDIEQYSLHDALDAITPSIKESPDFDFYRQQQKVWSESHNVSTLKGAKDPNSPNNLAAWTLDKYKNIHIVETTWKLKPEMDWYVFVDADTYVVWATFLRWLSGLDASKKGWFGSMSCRGHMNFAHGGSGIVLSKSAVNDLVAVHTGTAARWDPEIHSECCGDVILAKALIEIGIGFTNIWPSISGQKPATMPFLDENWCQPTLTMHHVTPSEMLEFHDFERRRSNKFIPITHAEIFTSLLQEPLQSMISPCEEWDNTFAWKNDLASAWSEQEQSLQTESFDACATACEANAACVQYVYDGAVCYIGKTIRLGERREPEGSRRWTSGWHQQRIAEWISKQKTCEPHKFPASLERTGFNC